MEINFDWEIEKISHKSWKVIGTSLFKKKEFRIQASNFQLDERG